MDQNWKNWCRLCSTENGEHVDLFVKAEHQFDLIPIIEKHLMLTISQYEEAPTSICVDCLNFILKLSQFAIRSAKVEYMFSELILRKTDYQESDAASVREIFEIDSLDDFVQIEVLHLPSAVKTETVEVGTDVPDIEEELINESDPFRNETSITSTKRKRGRPRKSDIEGPLQQLTPVEHKVIEDDEFPFELQMDTPEDDSEERDSEEDKTSENPEMKKKRKSLSKSGQKTLKCNLCDMTFATRGDKKIHMREDHIPEKPFECAQCSKTFVSIKRLKVHEKVHLPEEEKMLHPCPYCDKRFTKAVNVGAHIKSIHIGDRPFICEECGKSFNTKGALKGHQITHSEDCPFQCSYCPKKFKNLPRLRTHEDIHNNTVYVCPNCGIKLNTKRTLKMHMVVHSDQKKYKCNFCCNEYKRAKALKNHLILHTGLRPYMCPFCDKTFANGSNCRSHKKKSHPKELAAMEAAGEVPAVANIPTLEYLQPKAKDEDQEDDALHQSYEETLVEMEIAVEENLNDDLSLTVVKQEANQIM